MDKMFVNQLALRCKFSKRDEDYMHLAKILYRVCFLENKINRTLKGSHTPYCSKEDFFSVFYLILLNCVKKYDSKEGDFENYFSRMYCLALSNEKKQSFLKITGKTSDVVNKKGFATNISTSDVDVSKNFDFESERNLMNKEMIQKLKNIPDGDILIYKYLSDLKKTKTNQEVAEMFNLTIKQVRTRLQKASEAFRKNNPTYLYDYYYNEKEDGLGCVVNIQSYADAA